MARDKGLLTDLQIRHWIKAGTPLAKTDGNGLTFTLSAAGATGWILRYRYGGRRRELSIGRYPDISLADARGIATIKRAEIMQGRNPAADKQKAKATAAKDWTVRELVKDYRAKKLVSLAESTQVSYGRHLKRIENRLGALTVREIEASDVIALIEASSLTWGESNMLLITAKCLFTHACGKRLVNTNPCHGIMLSALLGERPPKRQRLMLTKEELHLLLNAGMRKRNALAIRVLLATAVRSAQLYKAKWEDVHLDEVRWHIPKSKTGPRWIFRLRLSSSGGSRNCTSWPASRLMCCPHGRAVALREMAAIPTLARTASAKRSATGLTSRSRRCAASHRTTCAAR